MTGIWEDSVGFLVLAAWVADRDWQKGFGAVTQVEGQVSYPIEDYSEVYDGLIEVLDPTSGTVLASRRLDDVGMPIAVVRPGVIAVRRESEVGWWFADVWRVVLDADVLEDSLPPVR